MSGWVPSNKVCEECDSVTGRSQLSSMGIKKRHIYKDGCGSRLGFCSKCGLAKEYSPQNIRNTIATGLANGRMTTDDAMYILNSNFYGKFTVCKIIDNDVKNSAYLYFCAGVPDDVRKIILEDILGNRIEVTSGENEVRDNRLNQNIRILYHQTSEEAWVTIRASGKMLRGNDGLAGAGIYFAESPRGTMGKVHHKGVMITARVKLGRVKVIPETGGACTFRGLLSQGYDSVQIPRQNGTEWVVYNHDQVQILSGNSC